MLKGIDSVLSPDLLALMASMGHGDVLALVDANHPAEAIARASISGQLVRLPGLSVERVLSAVLSLLPLDDFEPAPLRFMEVVGRPEEVPPARIAMEEVARKSGFAGVFVALERFAFYAEARNAFCVVQCGDARPYGNVLIRKGVIFPS